MKKQLLTLFVAAVCLSASADNDPKVVVGDQTIAKTVKQLTFDGDNVVLHFEDGTDQTADMADVKIVFSLTDAIKALEGVDQDAVTTYFDLNGRQLKQAPQKGAYIIKKGNKIVKLLTK